MAIEYVFVLSKKQKYDYKTHDNSAFINVRSCIAFSRDSSDDGTTRQIAYHAHSDYEMHFILEGECEFEMDNGARYKICKNQYIIIPHEKRHRIISESEHFSKLLTGFEIKLNPENESGFYRAFERRILDLETKSANDELIYLVSKLVKNAREKKHEYKSLIYSYLYSYIIETARITVGGTQIRKNPEYDDARLAQAVEFIKANMLKGISSKEVADVCFISTKQLVRIFQKHLSTTPSEYIRRLKIDYARRLLLETDIQISEIAEQLGFAEVTAFINFFRRYEDITPARFRKRSR